MASKERKFGPALPGDENPEWTEAQFAKARPGSVVFAELGMTPPRPRGRPAAANPKKPVSIRLDPEVVSFFKASGSGWQTRLNEVLIEHIKDEKKKRA